MDNLSSGDIPTALMACKIVKAIYRWLHITPLGVPVEPDVNMIHKSASGGILIPRFSPSRRVERLSRLMRIGLTVEVVQDSAEVLCTLSVISNRASRVDRINRFLSAGKDGAR